MSDDTDRGGSRVPPMPVPVPTPGIPQDDILWTQWADAAARAGRLDGDPAALLRRLGFDADLGEAVYADDLAAEFPDAADVLRDLAAGGLATRLAAGGYWPGCHAAAEAARTAQPLLDALAALVRAGAAAILEDRWFRVDPDVLAATVRAADNGLSPLARIPAQVLDELARFLTEDGWLERRGAAHWRFTARTLAQRGPAPGPGSPFPARRSAPTGLRSLFAAADTVGDEADARRHAARRAARDRGLDERHQNVAAALAAAADPDTRLVRSVSRRNLAQAAGVSPDAVRPILRRLSAADLIDQLHPGGKGPKDLSTYMVLCLDQRTTPSPADWAERQARRLPALDADVLRVLGGHADPETLLASVRLRAVGRAVGRDHTVVAAVLERLEKAGLALVVHRGGQRRDDFAKIVLPVPAEP